MNLVEVRSAVVDAAHVAPGKIGGDISAVDVILGFGRGDNLLQRVAGGLEDFCVEEPVAGPQGCSCGAGCKGEQQGAKSSKAHVMYDEALNCCLSTPRLNTRVSGRRRRP